MSSDNPSVARVLLVAVPARQRELAPWLRAVGQPVRYDLDLVEPSSAAPRLDPAWSVIVVDGDSIATDAERESVLRRMREQQFASVLYVAQQAASDPGVERDQAFAWASDTILQGWELGDRLRRRVQEIALAPWRRSMALRSEAERLGDRRLRVVRFGVASDEDGSERHTGDWRAHRAMPFVIAERASRQGPAVAALVADAFHEGRRVGVISARESVDDLCERLLHQLERSLESMPADLAEELERGLETAPGSPLVAARFGGATYVLGVLRDEVRRLARAELAAIERHEARTGEDR
jgi:hypothetical protein